MFLEDLVDLVLAYGDSMQPEWTALERDGEALTNWGLRDAMLRAATRLADGKGTVVVCDDDPLSHTWAALGALACGRVPVLVDARFPDDALARVAARAEATQVVGRAIPGLELIEPDELMDARPMEPRRFPGDSIGTIILTSGSTGEPKLVQRTRRADLHTATGLRISDLPMRAGDRFWMAIPHAVGSWAGLVFAAFVARMTCVFGPFRKETAARFLAEQRIKGAYMVPTMIRLARQYEGLDHPGWRSLRFLIVGGEKLDDMTLNYLLTTFGDRLYMGYGMTESPRVCEATARDMRERPGTVGRAIALRQFMIAKPGTTESVAVGEEGEVLVRSPDLFYGYLGEERPGEWHRSGDIGRADQDGYLFITGRSDTVVNVGGNRLSTEEVASALHGHPLIDDAAVIALPDPVWTHRLHAFVVVRDGVVDPAALRTWLRDRLPAYKQPRALTILPTMPQDGSGKLSLATLRRIAEEGQPMETV